MIRKITIDQLLPDMYVVDLHKRWFDHSLWQSKFKVRDEAHVWKLKEDGITDFPGNYEDYLTTQGIE